MASVFSSRAASFHYSSDPHDQLTQSLRTSHGFHSPQHIPNSSVTVELIYLLIGTIVRSCIRHSSHPFMEPRKMTSAHP